jgi:hypothetical protein
MLPVWKFKVDFLHKEKRLEDKPPCSSWKNKEPVEYSENDREIKKIPIDEDGDPV